MVSTFAGVAGETGTTTNTQFGSPYDVAADSSGNIYVVDTENHLIRKITSAGVVPRFAGSGTEGYKDATGIEA